MYKVATILQPGDNNSKISHGTGYKAYTISLASSDSSGYNMCARAIRRSKIEEFLDRGWDIPEIGQWANARGLSMCSHGCVTWEAGHGRSDFVRDARINLTNWLRENPRSFGAYLRRGIDKAERNKGDSEIACRPNVDSDERWEKRFPWMFDYAWKWYDYTKLSDRLGRAPYHLTYSYNDGTTYDDWKRVYDTGSNISVVFDALWNPWGNQFGYLPATWTDPNGKVWRVIDGDKSDYRFLDDQDVCVGLRLKADPERRDEMRETEFVVPTGIDMVGEGHPSELSFGHYLAG